MLVFFFLFTTIFILISQYVGYKIFGDYLTQAYKNYLFPTIRMFGAFYSGTIDFEAQVDHRNEVPETLAQNSQDITT